MDLIFSYAQKVCQKYTNKNRLFIKLEIFLYRTYKKFFFMCMFKHLIVLFYLCTVKRSF